MMSPTFLTRSIFNDREIADLFGDESIAAAMLSVEVALARAEASLGVIPVEGAAAIEHACRNLVLDMHHLENGVAAAGVPVPALVQLIRNAVGTPANGWVHWGATSQDIVDTAMMICARAALERMAARLSEQIDHLQSASMEFADLVMAGRTRGQLATPITFGLRIAYWSQPLIAIESELRTLKARTLRVQFGGATGSQTAIAPNGPQISSKLAEELGLEPGPPWHTDRTPILELTNWLARLVSAQAKIATDVVVMSRAEINELRAGETGGSSTMPQKANPVTAEAIGSLSRVSQAAKAGIDASAVHAEDRDGAMWAVEWELLPQLFEYAGATLRHGTKLVGSLQPNSDRMLSRFSENSEIMAEAVVFGLASKIGKEASLELVKKALADNGMFSDALSKLSPDDVEIDNLLDPRSAIEPSKAIAQQIFSSRKSDH